MTNEQPPTTRETLAAYRRGEATLDDVSRAANRTISRYYDQTQREPPEVMAPRAEREAPSR